MLVGAFVLGVLVFLSWCIGRLRSPEILLLVPFLGGMVLIPVLGIAPAISIDHGTVILVAFLVFEWLILTAFGMTQENPANPEWMMPNETENVNPQRILAYVLIAILLVYCVNVGKAIITSPSLSAYFLTQRDLAHEGEGVDSTSPLAYRAINMAMALILYMYASRPGAPKPPEVMKIRNRLIGALLFFGGLASLLEGNRSTLIVTLLALATGGFVLGWLSVKRAVKYASLFFVAFVLSMQLLRLDGDFSWDGVLLAMSWFTIYAFGSVISFGNLIEMDIKTYWYAMDIIAHKFGDAWVQLVGAREFFIMDYVPVGDLHTNIYSGYGVLYDYMGAWALIFIVIRAALFFFVQRCARKSSSWRACYFALLSSFPLTVYHEFFITAAYYCLNILWVTCLLAFMGRFFGGSRILALKGS